MVSINIPAAGLVQPEDIALKSHDPARRQATGENSFKNLLNTAVHNLNDSQKKADATVAGFLTGEVEELHTVMVAMGEARLTMQLAVEVRNKVVEAYQEVSRMQV